MKSFHLEPVKWLTILSVVIAALIQVNAEYHLLPEGWMRWVLAAGMLTGLVLVGIRTYDSVTPLARPRDNANVPLVPVNHPRAEQH